MRYQLLNLAVFYSQPFSDFVPDFGHPRDMATLAEWKREHERKK